MPGRVGHDGTESPGHHLGGRRRGDPIKTIDKYKDQDRLHGSFAETLGVSKLRLFLNRNNGIGCFVSHCISARLLIIRLKQVHADSFSYFAQKRHMEIPTGNSPKDVAARRTIIANFYREWKIANPSHRRLNFSLKEYINIRFVSITETCTHASRTYLSTLAVLQLDAVLTYAKKVGEVPAKPNGNQKPFDKMIVMRYDCPGIGPVKMTVGVRRGNHEKVQYCITAIES